MRRSIPILLALAALGACNPPIDTANGDTSTTDTNSTDTGTTDTGTTDTSTIDTGTAAVTEMDCSQITADHTVDMVSISFSPSDLTLSAGQTVEWTNSDSVTHTVTSGTPGNPDGVFDSGNISGGGTYCLKFNTAASYDYYCRIHLSNMTGTLTAQ